jgi:murein DD-endopeptidase MepM/ murein hydrolase activator NlpD
LKRILLLFVILIVTFSCKNDDKSATSVKQKPDPIIIEFGFRFNDFDVVQDTIQNGDTFGSILASQNINPQQVHEIVQKAKDTFNIKNIRAGKLYTLLRAKDKTKKLQVFVYQPDKINYFVLDLRDSIKVYKGQKPLTFKRRIIAGELDGSLAETLQKQGVSPTLTANLINVYKWSVDFFKSKKGDKFAITFVERYANDTIFDGIENLEAAFFEAKGKKNYAFRFQQDTSSQKVDYYNEEAKALKNFFLKAPLKSINITSRFARNRFHPVQQIWKAHNGTDYAAPSGTPIMTTASGTVEQTGYTAGNGNFVKVKHDRTYATQYLHMSKILVRRGQFVKQGDVIGRVGSTGLATGPHVCYRFWKNGVQVDALRLKLPNSEPLNPKYKTRFLSQMAPLKKELDSVAAIRFRS